ncbi:MAG: HprK-related kinase A, partial [Betaproteobacteria bacterium HGW-Betaproteobacteria-21]
ASWMMRADCRYADVSICDLNTALEADGLWLPYGACHVCVRGAVPGFAEMLRRVYGAFPCLTQADFADFHVQLKHGRGLRRYLRPQVRFSIDGVEPFEPFPVTNALPLFEWGVNWCFGQRFNQFVLLHAGVLESNGRALVMPAVPGSGKSTLTAALMLSGFRLLSDEFGVLRPEDGRLLPMLKPIALKNESIGVIRKFAPDACLGPMFAGTRKGDVSHLAPNRASVDGRERAVVPAVVLFPRWEAGAALSLLPQATEQAFARLAFNSFNYGLLGPRSFNAVADLVESSRSYQLTYSRLDEALDCVRALMAGEEP